MANETGHVKNVANFKTLITYLQSLGSNYAPSKSTDSVTALMHLYTDAEAAIKILTDAMPSYSNAVDEQQAIFGTLPKLATRVSSAYRYAVGSKEAAASVESLKNAIAGNKGKKINGEAAAKLAADGAKPETRSTSQQSYDNQQQNFEQMVQMAVAQPDYKPNEDDLKVISLTAHSAMLKQKTQAVDTAYVPILNARNKRDKVLYTEDVSVKNAITSVKNYLRSVYGASSPELKYVNSFKFRSPKK